MWSLIPEWSSPLLTSGYVCHSYLVSSKTYRTFRLNILLLCFLGLCVFFIPICIILYFSLQDFTLCLKHRSLLSRLSPKKSLTLPAAKIRKFPLVLVRVHATQKSKLSLQSLLFLLKFVCCFQLTVSQDQVKDHHVG